MNRRSFVAGFAALLGVSTAHGRTIDLCDPELLRLISSSGQPITETAEVFGCQRNHAQGLEYGVVRATQANVLYEAIGPEAVALVESIDRMALDDRFAISLRFDRAQSEIITLGANNTVNFMDIGHERIMLHETWMNNVRRRFFDNFESYALANRRQESDLWDYMEWFVLRRDITLEVLSANMNPMAATGFRDSHNYGYLPWPWHLLHSGSMKTYLDEVG